METLLCLLGSTTIRNGVVDHGSIYKVYSHSISVSLQWIKFYGRGFAPYAKEIKMNGRYSLIIMQEHEQYERLSNGQVSIAIISIMRQIM